MKKIESFLTSLRANKKEGLIYLVFFDVILLALVLIYPVVSHIPPHPDEHQFFMNAWSIMGGKQLHNFLHVALTEYALSFFFVLANVLTRSGVNFPQGDPSQVTYFYAHIFGFLLYLATFILSCLLLQRGSSGLRPRTVIFAVLYFGSIGLFERFLRVNSDSMSIFVTLNYLYLSLILQSRKSSLWTFFIFNLIFVFLGSFTNFKSLYLVLPIFLVNFCFSLYWWSQNQTEKEGKKISLIYLTLAQIVLLLAGVVVLWYALIPKPVDPHTFWYNVKNTTVRGTGFEFEYPTQSYNSWAVYIYDFFVEYLGASQFLAVLLFLVFGLWLGREKIVSYWKLRLRQKFSLAEIRQNGLAQHPDLMIFLVMAFYYLGVSVTLVHWSRWGSPLGFFGIFLLSVGLEPVFLRLKEDWRLAKPFFYVFLTGLFILAWSLIFFLVRDLRASGFPQKEGYFLTYVDTNHFLQEEGIGPEEAKKKVAWFTGYTSNVGNTSLEKLVEPEGQQIRYLLWPFWNIGVLYTERPVDRSVHNQRALVDQYAESISFRFPTVMARYMHETKKFAWAVLGLTWNPEMDSLVEPQYGVVKLRDFPRNSLSFAYSVNFKDLSHAYSPDSLIFSYQNLPDTYIFDPCVTNPDVYYVSNGQPVPAPPELTRGGIGGKTAGLYCHSLWYRVFLKGLYAIKIEGLPLDLNNSQKVYSTLPFAWDPITQTMHFGFNETRISAEFGVATKEKSIPGLTFKVSYLLEPDKEAKKGPLK